MLELCLYLGNTMQIFSTAQCLTPRGWQRNYTIWKNLKTTNIFSPEILHLLQLDMEMYFKHGYWDDNKPSLKAAHKF